MATLCEYPLLSSIQDVVFGSPCGNETSMTFVVSLSILAAVLLVLAIALAFGFRILEFVGFTPEETFEWGLFAAGISFPLIGFLVFGLSIPGWLGMRTAWGLITVLAIVSWRGWFLLRNWLSSVVKIITHCRENAGFVDRVTFTLLALVIVLEALVSVAPLTGSDAMNYHFTTPLLELGHPLHPIFWLIHSFLTGQAHLLISLGMALGSERISLALIFLGGLLTAGVLFVIARQLMPYQWALLAVLTFSISPIVFWQITTSGSPDIWMGFYVGLAIVAATRAIQEASMKFVLLAGFFAGAAAGVKYTGWIVPFAICVYILFASRSWKLTFACGITSLIAGALTQVRNFVWTGDPFFPFLMQRLNPGKVNAFVLHSLVTDTRASNFSTNWFHLLTFPFNFVLDGNDYGLGQYFGPIVLAFAPLLLFARWKSHIARLSATVWALVFASNALTTQMGRFLLPVYILALTLVFSGVAGLFARKWKSASYACAATLVLFLMFAGLSDIVYARDFLPVVFGRENKKAFLQRMGTDYRFSSFINSTLGPETQHKSGNVLIFFRHLYYLRVPYVYGDPSFSWSIDPSKCNEPTELLRVLEDLNVRWVVKSPEYPDALAESFRGLEAENKLIPIASMNIETRTGSSRIYKETRTFDVEILALQK